MRGRGRADEHALQRHLGRDREDVGRTGEEESAGESEGAAGSGEEGARHGADAGVRATAEQVFAKLDEPVPLGYSASGEVVEAGRGAAELQPGDRVAIAGAGYANHAEFNFVPRNLCAKIPEGVSYADAAFATIGAIALQGVRQAQPLIGERVVVIGLGLIGLLTVQILKANGCAVLGVDPDEQRAALATRLGADVAVSSGADRACAAFTGGYAGGCRHHRRGYAEQPADRAGSGAVAPQGAGGCRRPGGHAGAT